jgi:hypothetical protein
VISERKHDLRYLAIWISTKSFCSTAIFSWKKDRGQLYDFHEFQQKLGEHISIVYTKSRISPKETKKKTFHVTRRRRKQYPGAKERSGRVALKWEKKRRRNRCSTAEQNPRNTARMLFLHILGTHLLHGILQRRQMLMHIPCLGDCITLQQHLPDERPHRTLFINLDFAVAEAGTASTAGVA